MPGPPPIIPPKFDQVPILEDIASPIADLLGLDRIDGIIDFLEDPCVAPWTLYLKKALPAAGETFTDYIWSGFDQVIRGYARPNSVRRRMKRGIGRRGKVTRWASADPANELGRLLPGSKMVSSRSVSAGVERLWMIDGAIQRGAFWWMVGDLSLGFLDKWLSGVQETQQCQTQMLGHLLKIGDATHIGVMNTPLLLGTHETVKEWGAVTSGGNSQFNIHDTPAEIIWGYNAIGRVPGCTTSTWLQGPNEGPYDGLGKGTMSRDPRTGDHIGRRKITQPGTYVVVVEGHG